MTRIRTGGFSLVELIVTVALVSILVGLALPLARNTIQREKEKELHQALRDMRAAIDRYKTAADRGRSWRTRWRMAILRIWRLLPTAWICSTR